MKIYYGIIDNSIDVTNICIEKLLNDNIIEIPDGDVNRSNYFTDPLYGVHKKIIIEIDGVTNEYDEFIQIKIDTINNTIETIKKHFNIINNENQNNIDNKIMNIHSKLKINYGSFNEELPEQKMVIRYLKGNEKVLELGGNIGRNSLIIASVLENNNNLVTLECDKNIAKQLKTNRDLNNLKFHVESSALSKRQLIQQKPDDPQSLYDTNHFCHFNYHTVESDVLYDGYTVVNTLTFDEPDVKTFRNLTLATEALRIGGNVPCVLNAANEIAVYAFLKNRIGFLDMTDLIERTLEKIEFIAHPSLDDYYETDGAARDFAASTIQL